jgi:hypothetical protein
MQAPILIVGAGPAPARAYIDVLLPDILDDRIEPGPAAQPTRTEERTAETTSATGNRDPCREPAKATTLVRGNGCWH